jgi:hypothetical protein
MLHAVCSHLVVHVSMLFETLVSNIDLAATGSHQQSTSDRLCSLYFLPLYTSEYQNIHQLQLNILAGASAKYQYPHFCHYLSFENFWFLLPLVSM